MGVFNLQPRRFNPLVHILFWGLNLLPAFTITYGFLILLYEAVTHATFRDLQQITTTVPWDILVTLAIFFSMPIVAIVGVAITKTYRHPGKLLQILFGVEVPIMAFTLARLLFLKSLNPVNTLFLATAALSITAYLVYIFKKRYSSPFILTLQLFAHQAAVVVGIYASLLMFFFLPIVGALISNTVSSMLKADVWSDIFQMQNFFQVIFVLLAMSTFGTIFLSLVSSPFVGLYLYWRGANRLGTVLQTKTNRSFPRVSRWAFSGAYALTVAFLAYQGSLLWFNGQIAAFNNAKSFEDRSLVATRILRRKNFVERRLVASYLAHYQYLTDSSMTALQQAYVDLVKLDKPQAEKAQKLFTTIAFPFVYNGKFEDDVKKADQDYQTIFDEPIQIAETKRVNDILSSSFQLNADPLKSSVLDREDTDVKLVSRLVSAQPDHTGQFATVTIEEEYENLTRDEQEVLYVFSLPQDSVMIDLKLGSDLELGKEQIEMAAATPAPTPASTVNETAGATPNPSNIPQPIEHKDQGEVAAKGAANQTFESQYRLRKDPAILEQVGPVQYKLRIYPIPVKEANLNQWQVDRLREPVKNQKVRYSYVTALDPFGQAALPTFTEARNVYSNSNTIFKYNTVNTQNERLTATSQTVPVVARSTAECGTQPLQLSNDSRQTLYLPHSVNPWFKNAGLTFDCQNQFAGAENLIQGKRIAILADSSYSMGVKDWQTYLTEQLPLNQLLDTNTVDMYYFNDVVSQPISLNQQRHNPKAWQQVAFGKTNRLHALKEIENKYDVVLLFTDSSEADQAGDTTVSPTTSQPIYVIHKNGIIPKLPDALTYYLQTNQARVVKTGSEALQNFAAYLAVRNSVATGSILVGESGTWISAPASTVQSPIELLIPNLTSGDPVAKVLTHRQIEGEMRELSANLNQVSVLDALNQTAQQSGIVTPYSSFIVLVTDEQKAQLQRAARGDGRYQVAYDLGEQPIIDPTTGGLLGTSAVPEPHEWALLLSGGVLILYLGRHRLRTLALHHE